MEDIFEEIVKLKRRKEKATLATIVSIKGSTPREEGKMVIKSDGSIIGTIGGGSVEAEVCREAIKVMNGGKPKLLHFDLTGRETIEEEMIRGGICGGVMDIFVEPL